MKLFDFLSSEAGIISTFIIIAALSISIGTGGTMIMKYLNYQNTLDKVMDCRKTVGTNVSARVEHVCGEIPKWENFR